MKGKRNRRHSRWWSWITAAAAVVIVGAAVSAWLLIDPLATDNTGDRASAVQATFSVVFGVGGVITLGLVARRQWLQERIHQHTEYDAEQRRITEQYVQAVEQLGHEKAPVRLGGLYALDRLGRNHPEQRQVIAEVWCAYLRRRYTPPADIVGGTDLAADEKGEAGLTENLAQPEIEAVEEYEVRMTAQQLLTDHLKVPRPRQDRDHTRPAESEQYWHLEQLNLTGAVLIGADFTGCRIPELKAERAYFYRNTSFNGAHFEGDAWFGWARFNGRAEFGGTRFTRAVEFDGAHFNVEAWFSARFNGRAMFRMVHFKSRVLFSHARFRNASFDRAHFNHDADFDQAHFSSSSQFREALFANDARFNEARFSGYTSFGQACFEGHTSFDRAYFTGDADFIRTRFNGDILFSKAQFSGNAWFAEAQFNRRASFSEARFGPATDLFDAQRSPAAQISMTNATARCTDVDEIPGRSQHVWPPGWGPAYDGDIWMLVPIVEYQSGSAGERVNDVDQPSVGPDALPH